MCHGPGRGIPENRFLLHLVSVAPDAGADISAIHRAAAHWHLIADAPTDREFPAVSPLVHQSFLHGQSLGRGICSFLLPAGRFRLGRRPTCDIRLACPGVSREHLEIEVLPERGALVRDLGSTNGTRLGGKAMRYAAIESAVLIEVGPLRFILEPDVRRSR